MGDNLTGMLLVASPQLAEGVFAQSVCLVLHHGQTGAVGILLNRPLRTKVPGLTSMLSEALFQQAEPLALHFGGPLVGPILALHVEKHLAETQVSEGVYLAKDRNQVRQLLGSREKVRLMIGHAGWQPGQLEKEIAAGYWYTIPAHPQVIAEAHEDMWLEWLRKCVGLQLAAWVGASVPGHPLEN